MKKRKKREYRWYIEPLNEQTNKVVYELIKNRHLDTIVEPATCSDGKKHNLWECLFDIVLMMHKSEKSLDLNFKIYNQQDKGKIRPCPSFLFNKKRKRKKETAP